MMKRRKLLSWSASTLASATVLPFLRLDSTLQAGETRGSWTEESMVDYSMRLIDWVKKDFSKRSDLITQATGEPAPLNYSYFNGELSARDQRFQNDFLQNAVSLTASNRHIDSYLKDLERVCVELVKRENAAFTKWKMPTVEELAMRSGTVYETTIHSRNLGVILDNSPSMEPYLDNVRAEINRSFSGSYMVEVDGCQIRYSGGSTPWFYARACDTINPFSPERHCPEIPQFEDKKNAPKRNELPFVPPYQQFCNWQRDAASAIISMVQLMQVDAIYWFTDFDDNIEDEPLKGIAKLLLERKIKLYAHTMKLNPSPLLKLLIEKSGGELIKKPVR